MMAFIPGLPGGSEWIIILIIALLIFGKRLPEVMRSMGQSIKQFKKGMEETDVSLDSQEGEEETESALSAPDENQEGSEEADENLKG